MLTLTSAQQSALRKDMLARFKARMGAHIRAFAEDRIAAAGDDGLRLFVDRRVDEAIAFGLRQRGPVRCWLELSVVLGAGFERDPQHAPLLPDIDAQQWPMPYAQRLHANASAYLRECFGADRAILGRVIGQVVTQELPRAGDVATFLLDTVRDVWPERIEFAGAGPLRALAPAAEQAATQAGLVSSRGRLLAATLCLCFGAGVMADPLYPFLQARLAEDRPEAERIERTLKGLRIYAAQVAERYPPDV